jgi:hypothetical protein
MLPEVGEREQYYRGALRGLRFVEARRASSRRFGAEADARWSRFKGGLMQIDRMELLLRDADAEWPSAFGAHGVFSLGYSGDDEPFGPEWPSLVPQRAAKLWTEEMGEALAANEAKLSHALARIADAWELSLGKLSTPDVGPNDRLLVVGPTAILAVARAFEAGKALSLTEQVTVVATPAAHRQLGFFLTAAFDQRAATRVLSAVELAAFKLPKAIRLIESKDAHTEDLAAAHKRMEGSR